MKGAIGQELGKSVDVLDIIADHSPSNEVAAARQHLIHLPSAALGPLVWRG